MGAIAGARASSSRVDVMRESDAGTQHKYSNHVPTTPLTICEPLRSAVGMYMQSQLTIILCMERFRSHAHVKADVDYPSQAEVEPRTLAL